MFRKILFAFALVALLTPTFMTASAYAATSAQSKPLMGVVVSLNGKNALYVQVASLTIEPRAILVSVDNNTAITLNGEKADYSELQVGDRVRITFQPTFSQTLLAQTIDATRLKILVKAVKANH